ncbi:hypothetical protein, partial [Aeromonas caviae]|uniref:hypothetical protein n=1 Tax=Aeromonas caviae TaxID=648 RepID=UPI00403A2D9B
QFHRHQHAAVSALIPLVKRGGVVVLFAHAEAHEEAAPLDQWYERRDGGVLVPVELVEVPNGKRGSRDEL